MASDKPPLPFSTLHLPPNCFNDVCRVCLSNAKVMVPIKEINFTHYLNMEGSPDNISLISVFLKFCNIKITDYDCKPQRICEACLDMSCKAFNFFQLFICSNELLERKIHGAPEKNARKSIEKRFDLGKFFVEILELKDSFPTIENNKTKEEDSMEVASIASSSAKNEHDYCSSLESKPKISLSQFLEQLSNNMNIKKKPDELFKCKLCKKNLYSLAQLKEHSNTIHPEETTCLVCPKEYMQRWQYDFHLASHSQRAPLCKQCFVHFETKEALDDHNASTDHSTLSCYVCKKQVGKRKSLAKHLEVHFKGKQQQHQCPNCPQVFLYYANMKRHIRHVHLKERKFMCQFCSNCFSAHYSLKMHLQKMHGVDLGLKVKKVRCPRDVDTLEDDDTGAGFDCQYCTMKFKRIRYFYEHSAFHSEFKDYECTVCPLKFKTFGNWHEHQRTHARFGCDKCNEKFMSRGELSQHVRKRNCFLQKKESVFKCQFCTVVYKRKYAFYQHSAKHPEYKDYKCQSCGMVFEKLKHLQEHTNIHKVYQCPKCHKRFISKLALSVHKYNVHNQSNTTCSICGLQVSGVQGLANHMNVHTGKRPHLCELCGKGFKQRGHLVVHMVQHGAKKPYSCRLCDKAFHFGAVLRQHIRTHTGEKPYGCLYCPRQFRDSTSRHKHIKKAHADKFGEYELYRRDHLRDEISQIEAVTDDE